jgi:hypothetical protein
MTEVSYLSLYQAGKEAFERGNYRQSIEYLESTIALINPASAQGGEVQMWLVTAYQAANRLLDATNLARKLTEHPYADIRKQSRQLLYILEAPRLKRPPEWLTEIPEITFSEEKDKRTYPVQSGSSAKKKSTNKQITQKNSSEMVVQDNFFVGMAFIIFLLIITSLAIIPLK